MQFLVHIVKMVQQGTQNMMQDVGIRGVNKLELIEGRGYFSNLRFASTSFNNEGQKFHLLIRVYIQNSEDENPLILSSTISPPIYVDSRKTVGNLDQKIQQYTRPFPIDLLEKKFSKKENRKKAEGNQDIGDDFNSLFNYLTAPNIRYKIKHPLFLNLKFKSCLSIYYNPQVIDSNLNSILETLQLHLTRDIMIQEDTSQNDKLFCILIQANGEENKFKKVTESIEYLNRGCLEILNDENLIPTNFIKISPYEELITYYQDNFDSLFKIYSQEKQNYNQTNSDESPNKNKFQENIQSLRQHSQSNEYSQFIKDFSPQSKGLDHNQNLTNSYLALEKLTEQQLQLIQQIESRLNSNQPQLHTEQFKQSYSQQQEQELLQKQQEQFIQTQRSYYQPQYTNYNINQSNFTQQYYQQFRQHNYHSQNRSSLNPIQHNTYINSNYQKQNDNKIVKQEQY